MRRFALPGILASLLQCGLADAHASGWYAGFDLGRARSEAQGWVVENALAAQGVGTSGAIERGAAAFGVSGGFRFWRHLALEASYGHLGAFAYTASTGSDAVVGKLAFRAASIAAIGSYAPTERWSFYGKLGAARIHADLEAQSMAGASAVSGASWSGSSLLVGAGATYELGNDIFARAGWNRYPQAGTALADKLGIDTYHVGIAVRF